ncbi:MAG: serine hydrolase [Anaerolineae bacterium]
MLHRTRAWAHFALIVAAVAVGLSLVLPLSAQDESYFPTTDWRISTPEAQGLDSAQLAGFFQTFSQKHFNLDSLLIVRNGYVVAEAYHPPFKQNMPHQLYSVTKSVTSALVGILLKDGYLKSLDTPVVSLFPERTIQNLNANKKAMTIRDLLTMRAGFACDVNTGADTNTEQMLASDDWLQYTLDMPMGSKPGTEFHYCNNVAFLLSGIVNQTTGMSAVDFAAEKLFGPLGITNYVWAVSPHGVAFGASDLQLTTRDMAKFGYLFLNDGKWNGQQIIPADYAKAAISPQTETGWQDTSYGYMWWYADSIKAPLALGSGGQYIRLDPERNIIAVVTGGFTEALRAPLQYPFTYFMATWNAADDALPENADAQQQLKDVIARIENPAAVTVQAQPEIAAQVSGQNYMLFTPVQLPQADLVPNQQVNATMVSFNFEDKASARLTFKFADGQEWVAPVSMNGVDAVSESPVGPIGATAEWLTDNELCISLKYVGASAMMRLDVSFIPGGIEILGTEYVTGQSHTAVGVMMQEQ